MAKGEARIYRALKRKRASLRSADETTFAAAYCIHLEQCVIQTQAAQFDGDTHRKRRVLAGYAQELALWRQGEASYKAARQDGILVFLGNG